MRIAIVSVLMGVWGCGGDGGGGETDAGPTPGVDSGPRRDTGAVPDEDAGPTPSGDAGPMGPGGSAFRGAVLFEERFEDADTTSRGWYDQGPAVLSDTEHAPVPGSTSSFRCHFPMGANVCDGRPGRHLFEEVESVYLSYWVKYDTGWVGSGRPYHPHEFHFITNQDDRYVGPANTHLTTYTEQVGLRPMMAIQDSRNVDTSCILRNDDSFVGCGGDFASYAFTEMRSVAACNGLLGDVDGRDCFDNGGSWYSARMWYGPGVAFTPGTWHFVEAYFRMNTITGGVGDVNGAIRMWIDGTEVIGSDRVLLRTGQHPDMRFNQFLSAQYIGDGSPVDQTVYYDDLTIARGVP